MGKNSVLEFLPSFLTVHKYLSGCKCQSVPRFRVSYCLPYICNEELKSRTILMLKSKKNTVHFFYWEKGG